MALKGHGLTGHGLKATMFFTRQEVKARVLSWRSCTFALLFNFLNSILKVFKMKKVLFFFLLACISGVSSANCAWGNCTPAERLQENRQNQLNQLNSINNSLQTIQQQQQFQQQQQQLQQQQIRPNDSSTWGAQPSYQQQPRCWVTSFGQVACM